MMAIAHALVGCSIAAAVPNPWVAGGLILTSHWVMDLIPHWDFGTDWESRSTKETAKLALIDTLAGYGLALVLFWKELPLFTILAAVWLANLSDYLTSVWFIFYEKKRPFPFLQPLRPLFYFIYKYQETYFHTRTTFWHGMATMGITVGLFMLLSLSR
jgi:hypothetical protein